MTDLVECLHEPLVSRVPLEMVGLKESWAQKIYSICSLAVTALIHSVLTLGVDQVCLQFVFCINGGHWPFWPAVFSFGSGGFRTQTFGRSTRTTNANVNNAEPRSIFVQLLPLIILFGFSLLSALPSLLTTPPVPDPRFAYSETKRYSTEMETGGLGIPYYVNPNEFSNHPVIGAELAKEGVKIGRVVEERVVETPDSAKDGGKEKDTQRQTKTRKVVRGKGKKRGPALRKFEDTVDRLYTQDLYSRCQRGIDRKQRDKEAEVGIFGIGTDWDKVRKIDGEVIESCEELKRFGLIAR